MGKRSVSYYPFQSKSLCSSAFWRGKLHCIFPPMFPIGWNVYYLLFSSLSRQRIPLQKTAAQPYQKKMLMNVEMLFVKSNKNQMSVYMEPFKLYKYASVIKYDKGQKLDYLSKAATAYVLLLMHWDFWRRKLRALVMWESNSAESFMALR